jgi:UDP-N-acetylglucosamine transferase subunit ALG13
MKIVCNTDRLSHFTKGKIYESLEVTKHIIVVLNNKKQDHTLSMEFVLANFAILIDEHNEKENNKYNLTGDGHENYV